MINWRTRILNPVFWLTIIPALFLTIEAFVEAWQVLVQVIQSGDIHLLEEKVIYFIQAAFGLLSCAGVINDPNTKGVSDSEQALEQNAPLPNVKEDILLNRNHGEQHAEHMKERGDHER